MDKSEITVDMLEKEIAECFELDKEYDELKTKVSAKYALLEQKQERVKEMLEVLELDSYKAKAGTFSYTMRQGFRVPTDMGNKLEFFEYLKSKDIFYELVSVNSQTLNSWVKKEQEIAEEQGNFDFQIPGLQKAQPTLKISMRKAKEKL